MPQGVRVAVDQATIGYDKLYTYLWPQDLGTPVPGVRVLVPFGGGNRRRQGLVVEVAEPEDLTRVKPVHSRLDEEPLLSPELLALARFLQERTFCPLFDAVRAMVPTGLYMQLRPVLRTAQDIPPEVLETLTPNERQVLAFVSKCPEGADRATLLRRLGLDEDAPALRHLLDVGALTCTQDAFRRTGDATVRMVRLTQPEGEEPSPLPKLTDRQQSVYRLLQDVGAASLREISYFTGVGPAVINALVKKGLAYTYDAEVLRAPYADAEEAPPLTPRPLSDEQQRAFDTLLPLLESRGPAAALLYGVTGSGKTAVYMQLIDRVIADGRQAIVLVPEISLTPQMMGLFLQRYGRRVAVLHSGLAIGERMDEWKRIRRGDAQIVVGTRSAVFAPCDRLGLIVMDEEQEHTYKSESSRGRGRCCCWPPPPRRSRASMPPRAGATRSCSSKAATATLRCPRSRWRICGKTPVRTRPSAACCTPPCGSVWTTGGRSSCCSTAAGSTPMCPAARAGSRSFARHAAYP